MHNIVIVLTTAIITLSVGMIGGYVLFLQASKKKIKSAEDKATKILADAEEEARNKFKEASIEAKEQVFRTKKALEKEITRRKLELERQEKKIERREDMLDNKFELIDKRERSVTSKEQQIDGKLKKVDDHLKELDDIKKRQVQRYEEISSMTVDQAKQSLLESLETEVKQESAVLIKRVETETREIAEKKARQIITLAIQRCATDQVSETTVSVVNLPNEEMKGRIIGREGRNIRALEAATGCNIIVDDTPEAVVLSCFDPLRREVARLSLQKLISDGRIHPARIEEIVEKTEKELLEHITEVGEQAAFDLGVHSLHPELIKLIGRLKYRTSYGQKVLQHVIEVAHLCKVMASELSVDEQLAKRAGLLHDIGKAVSYEMEGTHAMIGAELAKKYNEPPAIVHAIAAHHGEEELRTIIAVLVQASDAISAARPGARRETLESYIKRLEKLEEIAGSFEGVERSFAIQAGREIRIMVEPDKLNDAECVKLARDVTKKIEEDLEYPGQIKVTVLRETRAVEYAR
jgi:ribonuclease Y